MSARPSAKDARAKLDADAEKFAKQLVRTMNENDPKKEAAFEAREAARDAAVSKALAAHLAKRKK